MTKKPWFKLFHGDCFKILPTINFDINAVISDPPWGIKADVDYTRFTNGSHKKHNFGKDGIIGDSEPFDPNPWLKYPIVALWGAHCFCNKLELGRWLCWVKKREEKKFMSDAELCWINIKPTNGPPGVFVKQYIWDGWDKQGERSKTVHPTQKPIEIMKWTMEMAKVPEGSTVLDPYMGSGSTGIACLRTGRNFIGIEIDETYFNIAQMRISKAAHIKPEESVRPKKKGGLGL